MQNETRGEVRSATAMNTDLAVDGGSSGVPKSTKSKEGPMKLARYIICELSVCVLVAVAIAAGCVSTSQIEETASRIRAAGELGIAEVPQAAVHMRLAGEQMKLAEKMAANEEWDQAASMLKRAQADADLAILLFQEVREKTETMAVEERRRLREQNKEPLQESIPPNERSVP